MAIKNFTGDAKNKSFLDMYCSTELTGGIHNQLISLLLLHSFLSITAFLENALILTALHKVSSLHAPSKLLLSSLATTDLCVGLIAEPLAVTYLQTSLTEKWVIYRYAFSVFQTATYILCAVSLFTMTAISVDRLLALLLGLRYRQVVKLKRMYLAITFFWVVSILGSTIPFFSVSVTLWYTYILILVCLLTSIFSYARIFLTLRHNQVQIESHSTQGQPRKGIPFNVTRYRKTVASALWVQLTLLLCYLPQVIVDILILESGITQSLFVARAFAATLVFLNSSLNPIIYCWKIKEVRLAAKDTVRKLLCSSS